MTHASDDDLILTYYGETADHDEHLAQCADCSDRYHDLRAALEVMEAADVPARDDRYGLEVWQRIRHRLPDPPPRWYAVFQGTASSRSGRQGRWQIAAMSAAAALLLIAVSFTAGRLSMPEDTGVAVATAPDPAADDAMRRRVLMLTVADHLERSERVLTDIVNASAGADISTEQQWADDLVAASRLYRQDAIDTRELSIASLLDELERTLLEIVHRPSLATGDDLEEIRRRVDSLALLFKVRVMSSELRDLSEPAAAPPSSVTTTMG